MLHALLYYSTFCRATVALQEMLHALLYYSIPYRAIVCTALHEKLHALYSL